MQCSSCGNENQQNVSFCSKCGTSSKIEINTKPRKNFIKRFLFSVSYILLGLILISILSRVLFRGETLLSILSIVNIILGSLALFTVLSIPIGLAGVVYFMSKSHNEPVFSKYYTGMSIWSGVAPIVLLILSIIAFGVINLISHI